MAERSQEVAASQTTHRQRMEGRVVTAQIAQSFVGQGMAFLLGGGCIGGGFYLIAATPHDGSGWAAIITAVAGLAGVFMYGKRAQKAELAEKRDAAKK